MAYDDWKIAQEHGTLGFGKQKDPVTSYNGPIEHRTLEDSVRIEHGLGIGVPDDGMALHGTKEDELKVIVDNMIKAMVFVM